MREDRCITCSNVIEKIKGRFMMRFLAWKEPFLQIRARKCVHKIVNNLLLLYVCANLSRRTLNTHILHVYYVYKTLRQDVIEMCSRNKKWHNLWY